MTQAEIDAVARMLTTGPLLGKPIDLARSIVARIDAMRAKDPTP